MPEDINKCYFVLLFVTLLCVALLCYLTFVIFYYFALRYFVLFYCVTSHLLLLYVMLLCIMYLCACVLLCVSLLVSLHCVTLLYVALLRAVLLRSPHMTCSVRSDTQPHCLTSHLHSTAIKVASQIEQLLSLIDSLLNSTTLCAVLHVSMRAVHCLSRSQCACPYLQQLSLPPGGQ